MFSAPATSNRLDVHVARIRARPKPIRARMATGRTANDNRFVQYHVGS